MLNSLNRWINYYDIIVTSSPHNAPDIPLGGSLEYLYSRQQAGKSVKLISNETAAIRIADMDIDKTNNIASLLLQYSDTNASDPVFADLESGKLRLEPKLKGEGVAVSAHMTISLTPTEPEGECYLALLETVPGVTRTKITPFLNSEFKLACDWEFEDEKKQVRDCRPLVELRGYMAQSLKEGLEKGRLLGIELVKHSRGKTEFDIPGFTNEEKRKVLIKPSTFLTGNVAIDTINKIKDMAKGLSYDDIRINFKSQRQQTIECSTRQQDAADALYTKSTLIKVTDPLTQCSESLHEQVVKQTKQLIETERLKK